MKKYKNNKIEVFGLGGGGGGGGGALKLQRERERERERKRESKFSMLIQLCMHIYIYYIKTIVTIGELICMHTMSQMLPYYLRFNFYFFSILV